MKENRASTARIGPTSPARHSVLASSISLRSHFPFCDVITFLANITTSSSCFTTTNLLPTLPSQARGVVSLACDVANTLFTTHAIGHHAGRP
jgi:hypothetical protein